MLQRVEEAKGDVGKKGRKRRRREGKRRQRMRGGWWGKEEETRNEGEGIHERYMK